MWVISDIPKRSNADRIKEEPLAKNIEKSKLINNVVIELKRREEERPLMQKGPNESDRERERYRKYLRERE